MTHSKNDTFGRMWQIIEMWFCLRYFYRFQKNLPLAESLAGKTRRFERKHIVYMYASDTRKNPFVRWYNRHFVKCDPNLKPRNLGEILASLDPATTEPGLELRAEKASRLLRKAENFKPKLVLKETTMGKDYVSITPEGESFTEPANLVKKLADDYWGTLLAIGGLLAFVYGVISEITTLTISLMGE